MIITDVIERLSKIRKGRQIEKLNKSIELMTLEEIGYELTSKLSRIKKIEEIDGRTELLLSKIYDYGTAISKDYRITYTFLTLLKNNNLKLDFLSKFSPRMSEELIHDLITIRYTGILNNTSTDLKVKREEAINKIKRYINGITSKYVKREIKEENTSGRQIRGVFYGKRYEYPLKMKMSTKERDRAEKENEEFIKRAVSKIFISNYERLDVYEFFESPLVDSFTVEQIYDELPEEKKGIFFLEYIRATVNDSFYYLPVDEKERLENRILERVSIDRVKFEILENINNNTIYESLLKKVDITREDIRNYYRQTGSSSFVNSNRFIEMAKVETAEELIDELQYFKDFDRKRFFESFSVFLNEEEKSKLIDSEKIEEEFKDSICNTLLWYNRNNKEKAIHLCNRMIEKISNEKNKNTYRIVLAGINKDYDEMIKLMESGNYEYSHIIDEIIFRFPDDKLKELYDATDDDRIRYTLITLTKETSTISSMEFKLVNQENYIDFIKNAKSEREVHTLLSAFYFEEYRENLTKEQLIDIYNELKDKELKKSEVRAETKEERMKQIIKLIINSASVEECIYLSNLYFPNEYIRDSIREKIYEPQYDFKNIENVRKYLMLITNVKDMRIKETVSNTIEDVFCSVYAYGKEAELLIEEKNKQLKALYEELIDSDEVDIANKYYYLSKYMRICYKEERNIPGEVDYNRFVQKIEPRFRKLNELAGKNEYNEMFDFSPVFVKSSLNDSQINITNYDNIMECIKYLASDTVHDKLLELYEGNHSILKRINSSLLEDDVIELLDDDVIEFISRYGVDASQFKEVFENKDKTEIFFKAYGRLKTVKTYSEEDALKIANCIKNINPEEFIKDDGEINEKDIDVIIALSFSDRLFRNYRSVRIDEEDDKHKAITEAIKKDARAKIKSKLLTRKQALDAIGMRFLGLSYKELNEMNEKYAADVELLINKYKEKEELTLEEQNELVALRTLRNIKEIVSIKDKKALVETFKELDKLEEFDDIDFALVNTLEDNVRRAYAKDYKENIYSVKEEDKLEKEVDGIKVYSPKEFNMLVHVVAAYGNFELIDKKHPEKSSKEIWRNVDDKQNHILCTSYIGNSNLCFKRKMENEKEEGVNVIFGFSNFSENAILMAAPYDIVSDTKSMKSDNSVVASSFRTAKNMLKNTRWLHNEVCVERRLESNKNTNIEPDYIVCVDEINEESKKVAKDFGIPIVLIETEKIAERESQKINKLFEEFEKTNDPGKIEDLINLYQSNLNTYSNYKSDLAEKYFNQSQMNERIKKMMENIDVQYKMGNKENAINCYKALYESLQREIDLYVASDVDPEDGKRNEYKIRELKELAKSIYEKVKNEAPITKKATENREEGIAFGVISKVKERNKPSERE